MRHGTVGLAEACASGPIPAQILVNNAVDLLSRAHVGGTELIKVVSRHKDAVANVERDLVDLRVLEERVLAFLWSEEVDWRGGDP